MGAWGYEPSHNDGSWDMLAVIDRGIVSALETLFKQPTRKGPREGVAGTWDRWNRVGVAQLATEHYGISLPLWIAEQCHEDLEVILSDAIFMSEWRDPVEAKKKIVTLRRALERTIEYATSRRKVVARGVTSARRVSLAKRQPSLSHPLFGYETERMTRLIEAGIVRKHTFNPESVKWRGRKPVRKPRKRIKLATSSSLTVRRKKRTAGKKS